MALDNPWGRPYRIVMKYLRPAIEKLLPDALERVILTLFPREMHVQVENVEMEEWNPKIAIGVLELLEAGTCIPKGKVQMEY